MLAWVDVETTGLDYRRDTVIEIAVAITTNNLEMMALRSWVCWTVFPIDLWAPEALKMHSKSGLLDCVKNAPQNATPGAIAREVLEFLENSVQPGVPMAGSSVGFDRRMLERSMPKVERFFGYRTIDVSSIKELCMRWFPTAYDLRPNKVADEDKPHRAAPDVQASIEELKFYRDNVFVPSVAGMNA